MMCMGSTGQLPGIALDFETSLEFAWNPGCIHVSLTAEEPRMIRGTCCLLCGRRTPSFPTARLCSCACLRAPRSTSSSGCEEFWSCTEIACSLALEPCLPRLLRLRCLMCNALPEVPLTFALFLAFLCEPVLALLVTAPRRECQHPETASGIGSASFTARWLAVWRRCPRHQRRPTKWPCGVQLTNRVMPRGQGQL